MFGFIKKVFFATMKFFGFNGIVFSPSNVNSLESVSMKNQKCETRTKIIDINNNEPMLYPFSIKVNKCTGSCNDINSSYVNLCVPDVVKNINVEGFNLMSRINETRYIIWHETCKCICRLSASVYNNRQRWNEDKCRCECKELIDKGICDKGFIWNPSNRECECDKSCDLGEYLDYKNCKCRNSIVHKLVKEYTKIFAENKIYNETLNTISSNDSLSDRVSCSPFIVLVAVFLVTSVIIGSVFIYFCWRLKKDNVCIKSNPCTQTTIW